MKKFSILLLLCIALVGCKDKSTDFGTVKYYPSFLWVSDSISPVVKTMDCDFSIDAQNDASSFAEFQFVDNYDKPIPTSEMQVKVDGVVAEHNIFRVYSKTDSVKLEFTFSPEAETGKHQGYLRLINHKLDRFESQQLSNGQKVDARQWTLHYDRGMNPLKIWVLSLLVALIVVPLLVSLFLKYVFFRMRYPRFRAINKMMIIPNQAPIALKFKGKRMIVIDNQRHKQSAWNRFWTGEIQYIQNPSITTKITLKPVRKGTQIMFISNPTNYICTPNPIGMPPSTIKDLKNKVTITI